MSSNAAWQKENKQNETYSTVTFMYIKHTHRYKKPWKMSMYVGQIKRTYVKNVKWIFNVRLGRRMKLEMGNERETNTRTQATKE